MKFNSIFISEETTKSKKGIPEISLNRLSNVVALIGKNGSGKTRILDLFEEHLFDSLHVIDFMGKTIEHIPNSISSNTKQLKLFVDYLTDLKRFKQLDELSKKDPNNIQLKREIRNLTSSLSSKLHPNSRQIVSNNVDTIYSHIKTFQKKYIRRIRYNEIQELQEAIVENSKETISFESLIEMVAKNPYDEFKSIHKTGLDYLLSLPHMLSNDKHMAIFNNKNFEDSISFKRYTSFKTLFESLLKKELSWEQSIRENKLNRNGNFVTYFGIWKIDGREFNYKEFSEGEKLLFAYALLLFLIDQNPELDIRESILLVDEPELHLHPDSEIDLFEGLKSVVSEKGQLIFATHSLNILSHLNYDEIFTVKNGVINHPSQKTIGESLRELLNLENRVNKLSEFLSSISTWTFVNFMAQCFENPEVIESAREDDPQVLAFKSAIEKSNNSFNLMLDFGAGKGRLYEQLKKDYQFISKVNYCALEPSVSLHPTLIELGAKQVFETYKSLPVKAFDCVLLCNVLHEIPITEWLETLNSIIKSLKDDGFLMIIEAKILTKGEKIGKEGFLLLDKDEVQTLFGLDDLPGEIKVGDKADLITTSVISKNSMKPLTKKNIKAALQLLEKNSLNKIIELRNLAEEDFRNTTALGRKSAFLSQLHINSRIAQISISNNEDL